MKNIAFLFSGQGSQYKGMGQELFEKYDSVKALFATASELLDLDMAALCFGDSLEDLNQTENTQPAILLTSVASYQAFIEETKLTPKWLAGHSLGEISALVCANAMSFSEGIQLARARGLAMAKASDGANLGMSAITKIDSHQVREICQQQDAFSLDSSEKTFVVANYNSPKQTVLSGDKEALAAVGEILKTKEADVIPLRVSSAFHSPYMSDAAESLRQPLGEIEWQTPKIPVLSNVTARVHHNKEAIAESLVQQMTHPVLWQDTMHFLQRQHIDLYIESGPGDVLKKLAKANLDTHRSYALDKQEDSEPLLDFLAHDIRLVNEKPEFIGKCLAIAVSTRNANWDEQAYQEGVIQPYETIKKMQEEFGSQSKEPDEASMKTVLTLLNRIFETKGTSQIERKMRFQQLADIEGRSWISEFSS